MTNPDEFEKTKSAVSKDSTPPPWKSIRCPGLSSGAAGIRPLLEELAKRAAVFTYKQAKPLVWAIFVGGTGTGKSTLFNALCGKALSQTGVERPKTYGPIVYAHRNAPIEEGYPFPEVKLSRLTQDARDSAGHAGVAGQMTLLEHNIEDLSHLVLVDTPDLDSVEISNRQAVEDLYLLSDVIIFVSSQEKYADDVPYQFLERIAADGKPCFVLLNKVGPNLSAQEVFLTLHGHRLRIELRQFWILPYLPGDPVVGLIPREEFKDFQEAFSRSLTASEAPLLIEKEQKRSILDLQKRIRTLITLLEGERLASEKWLADLDLLFQTTCRNLLDEEEKHFAEESREYLQKEIRRHFGKYDLLRKPRRLVSQAVRLPLQLLGIIDRKREESHQEILTRIRQRIDLRPIRASVERFNRSVLEGLSPKDASSELFSGLRTPGMMLTDGEIQKRVFEEQEQLVLWLEETFRELERGIPKSKEWGIYSTSILWGGLILSLEAAIGGGISILEAVLDSAVAPFVTQGAVELFAYRELQKIAQELGKRYQNGLLSSLKDQRDRYAACLHSLMVRQEHLQWLKSEGKRLDRQVNTSKAEDGNAP